MMGGRFREQRINMKKKVQFRSLCLPLSPSCCYGNSYVLPGCGSLSSAGGVTTESAPAFVEHTDPPLSCGNRVPTQPVAQCQHVPTLGNADSWSALSWLQNWHPNTHGGGFFSLPSYPSKLGLAYVPMTFRPVRHSPLNTPSRQSPFARVKTPCRAGWKEERSERGGLSERRLRSKADAFYLPVDGPVVAKLPVKHRVVFWHQQAWTLTDRTDYVRKSIKNSLTVLFLKAM